MCIIGCNLKSQNGEEAVYSNYYHECGSAKMIDTAAVDCCLEDTRVAAHYRNVFLTWMVNASRSELNTLVSRRLHDAIIVKMIRGMMLVPVLLVIAWTVARKIGAQQNEDTNVGDSQNAKASITIPWPAFRPSMCLE